MRVWIDFANSPHIALLTPVITRLEREGHEVTLTARDHAQTVELARRCWPQIRVLGGSSPSLRTGKAVALARRGLELIRFARAERPHVALSHGSYAQIIAARTVGVPAVTMMDYEYQPANHLSFRLAQRILVPEVFPETALKRFGAAPQKVVRYPGFKEALYLDSFRADASILEQLGLDASRPVAVFRPPPDGALYHRRGNGRFDKILAAALDQQAVQIVLLPRNNEQQQRYRATSARVQIPDHAVDGGSLLARADVVIGAGGTMTREAAIIGTRTYTVFAGQLPAVDAELIRLGALHDLRDGDPPQFEQVGLRSPVPVNAAPILEAIFSALADACNTGEHQHRPVFQGVP